MRRYRRPRSTRHASIELIDRGISRAHRLWDRISLGAFGDRQGNAEKIEQAYGRELRASVQRAQCGRARPDPASDCVRSAPRTEGAVDILFGSTS